MISDQLGKKSEKWETKMQDFSFFLLLITQNIIYFFPGKIIYFPQFSEKSLTNYYI